jgi:hypothetical protein
MVAQWDVMLDKAHTIDRPFLFEVTKTELANSHFSINP